MKLNIDHVSKSFRRRNVLKDITLSAESGTCIGLLGENGCGKSTLMTILAGTRRADGGSFTCDGQDLFKDSGLRERITGFVPQGTPLLQELTALDNLRLWYECCDRDLKRDLEDGVPAMLGVTDFLKVQVSKMSGGMKKRLSISCAVAHRPSVLLLDEPSAALDLICRERINNYLLDFRDQGGILIIATHDVQEISMCDECYIMKGGMLEPYSFDGNVHKLVGKL